MVEHLVTFKPPRMGLHQRQKLLEAAQNLVEAERLPPAVQLSRMGTLPDEGLLFIVHGGNSISRSFIHYMVEVELEYGKPHKAKLLCLDRAEVNDLVADFAAKSRVPARV